VKPDERAEFVRRLRRDPGVPPGQAFHRKDHVKTYSRHQHVAAVLSQVRRLMVVYAVVEKAAIPAGSGLRTDHAIFYNYAADLIMERQRWRRDRIRRDR
jgi:hypothetical protein